MRLSQARSGRRPSCSFTKSNSSSKFRPLLERFADALSCIDQCFIADDLLEHLPLASQVGKTLVGGIDLNKARMRYVVEALIALSPANGFTASDVGARVRLLSEQSPLQYGPRHAAYDLKKLRGKQIVDRIRHTRRYETLPTGLRQRKLGVSQIFALPRWPITSRAVGWAPESQVRIRTPRWRKQDWHYGNGSRMASAPTRIIGTKYVNDTPADGVAFTRPMCPYPQLARYRGTGDTTECFEIHLRNRQ